MSRLERLRMRAAQFIVSVALRLHPDALEAFASSQYLQGKKQGFKDARIQVLKAYFAMEMSNEP